MLNPISFIKLKIDKLGKNNKAKVTFEIQPEHWIVVLLPLPSNDLLQWSYQIHQNHRVSLNINKV